MKGEPAIIAAQWVVGLLLCGGFGYYTAYRKGYKPGWWFLGGCGFLGLVILAFLPNTQDNCETKLSLRSRGNLIGIVLTVLVVALHLWAIGKFLGSK